MAFLNALGPQPDIDFPDFELLFVEASKEIAKA
ncbi:unnamed protein product, partial [Larinioides sclopetarius]